ncbi:MAG: DUF4842 domain-containing protein [Bacteroidales bacterium]|nr:DUF4842 domain-containing protein [Bacteroidales bacterium]
MRKTSYVKLIIGCMALGSTLTGCDDKYSYNPGWHRPSQSFTYETDKQLEATIDCSSMAAANVIFSIYDENPVTKGADGTLTLKNGLAPIFTGVTNSQGTFSEKIELPAYVNEAYVYVTNIATQHVVKATIEGNTLTASNRANATNIVTTLDSAPADALKGVAEVSETQVTLNENKGCYSFEHSWPSEGDCDMNDVIIKCGQSATWGIAKSGSADEEGTSYTISDKIMSEEFYFRTFQNYVTYTDGIYCYVDIPTGVIVEKEEYFIKKPGAAEWSTFEPAQRMHDETLYNKHGNYAYNNYGEGTMKVIWFTNSLRNEGVGSEYKVRLTYTKASQRQLKTAFHPFIAVRNGTIASGADVPYYEVHITLETPTNVMPLRYWSTGSDASLPSTVTKSGQGKFYLRANNVSQRPFGPWFPFALKLSGATETDIQPLLDRSKEGVPISNIYPNYHLWVITDGFRSSDWYKVRG